MPITETTGDLFALDFPAIGHGCNTRGSMDGGIALEFRRRFPQMYEAYRQECLAGRFELGAMFVWEADDVVIYNLATQRDPGRDARIDAVESSIRLALADAEERKIARLGVPRIGAGIGGLQWDDVREVLREAATDSPVELFAVSR